MSSFYASLPKLSLPFSARTVEDAPLKDLPDEEANIVQTLSKRLSNIFTSHTYLDRSDPWLTLSETERAYLYLRFARYNLLNVDKSEACVRSVALWRRDHKPWILSLVDYAVEKAGIPVFLSKIRGYDNEVLVYSPVCMYVRSKIDHRMQENATKAFFEHMLYTPGYRRASGAVVVVDFENLSQQNVDLVAARKTIRIFRSYYPESMIRIIFINYPTWWYGSKYSSIVSFFLF